MDLVGYSPTAHIGYGFRLPEGFEPYEHDAMPRDFGLDVVWDGDATGYGANDVYLVHKDTTVWTSWTAKKIGDELPVTPALEDDDFDAYFEAVGLDKPENEPSWWLVVNYG